MPQNIGQRQYQSFVKGLITEESELRFPVDASVDEDNCVLSRDGSRQRRLGADREASAVLSADIQETHFDSGSTVVYKWRNVAGEAARQFAVVQIGSVIRFHDLAADPITQKDFTINLNTYKFKGEHDPQSEMCDFTSGKGILFIVSKAIHPLRVEYHPNSDTITVEQTVLSIRDFEGVDDGLDFDEEPSLLSAKHKYNLTNQGWIKASVNNEDPIETFYNATGRYPGNNKQWIMGKDATTGNLDVTALNKVAAGLSQAPKGHWLISPLERHLGERERVSDVPDLDDRVFAAVLSGTVPTTPYTSTANTVALLHSEADTGAGDTDDSSSLDHTINFIGTEADLSGSWSHQTTTKVLGSGALRKLRGAGSSGSSRLNFLRQTDFEWGELVNDTDVTLECFFRLDDLFSDDAGPVLEDRLVFWAYWDEFSADRGWMWDWFPTAYSYTPTANDIGNTGPAGFSFAYSPDGFTIYRILPSEFPYQLYPDIWYYMAASLNQTSKTWQLFIQPYADLVINFGATDYPTEFVGQGTMLPGGLPIHESANNLFFGSEPSVTGTGSWKGYCDEIRIQKEIVWSGAPAEPVPPSAPSAVEFFAGRVCYAGGGSNGMAGRVLMSPVLERASQAGDCFQQGDPTAEVNSELVDSDGMDIIVDGMGECKRLVNVGTALLCLAENGVWVIQGSDATGFRATSFEVNKISHSGILGPRSLVNAGGKPYWWGEEGIFTIGSASDQSSALVVDNLSVDTMQGFYDGNDRFSAIPAWSKEYANGVYDQKNKRVVWFFRSTDPGDNTYRHKYDRALIFDQRLEAFYPWTFGSTGGTSPYVSGAISTGGVGLVAGEVNVADSDGDLVLDVGTANVVVTRNVTTGRDLDFKLLVVEPGSGVSNYTWGELKDTNFEDWATASGGAGTGANYTSYAECGYETGDSFGLYKWAPRILTACRRGTNNECTMQARWEWSDAAASGKFTTGQNIYLANNSDTDGSAGFPLIISQKKLRGRGHALSVRFTSATGKDFDLVGWSIEFAQNQRMS